MSNRETLNPPAFPAAAFSPMGDQWSQEGMSLRDWFAGQALAGVNDAAHRYCEEDGPRILAERAYRLADAMLAERAKGGAA